jgi:hypothetical protein
MDEFPKSFHGFKARQDMGVSHPYTIPDAEVVLATLYTPSVDAQEELVTPVYAEIIPAVEATATASPPSSSSLSSSSSKAAAAAAAAATTTTTTTSTTTPAGTATKVSDNLETLDLRSLKLDDPVNLRKFITEPLPDGIKPIQCTFKMSKPSKLSTKWEYRVYVNVPINDQGDTREIFLMRSGAILGLTSSTHLISMNGYEFPSETSKDFLGYLRGNFLGTEFTLDNRNQKYNNKTTLLSKGAAAAAEEGGGGQYSNDHIAIKYGTNAVWGSPRNYQIGIPFDYKQKKPCKWSKDEPLMTTLKRRDFTDMITVENRKPKWDDKVQSYILNFGGRVKIASVKNVILPKSSDRLEKNNMLLFGKVTKELEFVMDVSYPLSIFQAFGVAISSCDDKIGCG